MPVPRFTVTLIDGGKEQSRTCIIGVAYELSMTSKSTPSPILKVCPNYSKVYQNLSNGMFCIFCKYLISNDTVWLAAEGTPGIDHHGLNLYFRPKGLVEMANYEAMEDGGCEHYIIGDDDKPEESGSGEFEEEDGLSEDYAIDDDDESEESDEPHSRFKCSGTLVFSGQTMVEPVLLVVESVEEVVKECEL